jgi:hypothetical protein
MTSHEQFCYFSSLIIVRSFLGRSQLMLNQNIEKRQKKTQIDALVSVESHNFHYFLNKSMIK